MITKRNLIGVLIAAVLAVGGVGLILAGHSIYGEMLLFFGNSFASIFGLIMVLATSKIVGTIYWKIIFGTWIFSNLLSLLVFIPGINLGPVFLPILAVYFITYLVWFFKKKSIGHLDILKVFWVIFTTAVPIGIYFNSKLTPLLYGSGILLWLMIFDYLFIAYRSGKFLKEYKIIGKQ